MRGVPDFEDLLHLLHEHQVRYVIVGGLAFIFHAKPRYTKDMDLWVENTPENIRRANKALSEFGSPALLALDDPKQVIQIGIDPNRIDILLEIPSLQFAEAWAGHIESAYGGVSARWIDAESLWKIKSSIEHPRHQEDARILRQIIDKNK